MQPERATRGIAAVALSSAAVGIVLLALALLLSACGASSAGSPASSSAAASTAVSTPTASGSPRATTSSSAAAPTSPAAPTTSESVNPDGTVPTVPVTTAPAVPLTAAAPAVGGGSITVGTITSVQGTAQLPGEIAGPAVRVPVTIVNGSTTALDLDQVVVDLVDRSGVSAGQLTAAPAAPFTGTLAPRASASAVYVFSLAPDDRSGVRIIVSYTTAAPVVVFTGTIA